MTTPRTRRNTQDQSFLRILENAEISVGWVKPATDPQPNTPFPWRDLDLLIVISPPGIMAASPQGEQWLYSMGDTLVPETHLTALDPNYPWYHIMSAIQSIHHAPGIKKAAICSTNRADMRWWNQLCEEVAEKGFQLSESNTLQNGHISRNHENLWVTALLPLEAW